MMKAVGASSYADVQGAQAASCPSSFQLIRSRQLQRRVAFLLPGISVILKAKRPKDYSEFPQSLGQHLKWRRRVCRLLQREAADTLGVSVETYNNWEKDRTRPVASQFRSLIEFLSYDPSSPPETLAERLKAKRRALGATFDQVARHLDWDRSARNWRLRSRSRC
jgi:DNA-binding XRE family transcriptional regulator